MAGIGFELRRLLRERNDLFSRLRAYVSAGLISSGPWIMAILTLTLFSLGGPLIGGQQGYETFRGLVTYTFAFSLVVVGIGQMAVTRRMADLLYGNSFERVLPAFLACAAVTAAIQATIGTVFCVLAGLEVRLAFLAVTLYVVVSLSWLALVWLSVIRQFDEVIRAYIYGIGVSMLLFMALAGTQGVLGLIGSYTAGQGVTLALLIRAIVRGTNASGGRDLSILTSLADFPKLVWIGLLYNAAIWIDKIVFWFLDGSGPHPWIRFHPLYDTCTFLAYLTVIPALAVNLVRIETSFYETYRAYYGSILGGRPLRLIEEKKAEMLRSMRYGAMRLLRVQGAMTVVLIIFAPFVISALELPPEGTRIFRLACLGAFFHVVMLMVVLMQLYFDQRRAAVATSAVFLGLNLALAFWSVDTGVHTYGLGYAVASFLSLLLGTAFLLRGVKHLDYYTFTAQPIGSAAMGKRTWMHRLFGEDGWIDRWTAAREARRNAESTAEEADAEEGDADTPAEETPGSKGDAQPQAGTKSPEEAPGDETPASEGPGPAEEEGAGAEPRIELVEPAEKSGASAEEETATDEVPEKFAEAPVAESPEDEPSGSTDSNRPPTPELVIREKPAKKEHPPAKEEAKDEPAAVEGD